MINFGICGCGGFIEKAILPNMLAVKNANPIAAFDTDRERLERICNEFSIERACNSFEDLIALEEIDVIYISSPNVLHKEQTIAAAKAGKHVFCQKPMGMNAHECYEMIEACKMHSVKLGVGFCYTFGGAQQKVRQMIRDGIIGVASYMQISFSLGGYNPESAGWRYNPKLSGGGPLMDVAPHLIDLAFFLFSDTAESVMSYVRPDPSDTQIELDTVSILELKHGSRIVIDTSFERDHLHHYTVIGTEGEIFASGTMGWKAGGDLFLIKDGIKKQINFSLEEHINKEILEFCSAIEQNEPVPVPGEAGMHVQAVIDAIYESGRTGLRCSVKFS